MLSPSPNWTWISFREKSGFLSFVGSDFLQPGIPTTGWGGALMRNPKIKCCKLGFSPRSQPAPYLDPVWEEFYVQTPNSEISPSVSCHPATPHWYTIPQPPLKVKIYAFDPHCPRRGQNEKKIDRSWHWCQIFEHYVQGHHKKFKNRAMRGFREKAFFVFSPYGPNADFRAKNAVFWP